jgi:hypothetical protein
MSFQQVIKSGSDSNVADVSAAKRLKVDVAQVSERLKTSAAILSGI